MVRWNVIVHQKMIENGNIWAKVVRVCREDHIAPHSLVVFVHGTWTSTERVPSVRVQRMGPGEHVTLKVGSMEERLSTEFSKMTAPPDTAGRGQFCGPQNLRRSECRYTKF